MGEEEEPKSCKKHLHCPTCKVTVNSTSQLEAHCSGVCKTTDDYISCLKKKKDGNCTVGSVDLKEHYFRGNCVCKSLLFSWVYQARGTNKCLMVDGRALSPNAGSS